MITRENEVFEAYIDTNPFVHAIVIMNATARRGGLHNYDWLGLGYVDVGKSTIWMLTCMLGYMFLGFLFVWLARRRLRRNIF